MYAAVLITKGRLKAAEASAASKSVANILFFLKFFPWHKAEAAEYLIGRFTKRYKVYRGVQHTPCKADTKSIRRKKPPSKPESIERAGTKPEHRIQGCSFPLPRFGKPTRES